MMKSQSIRIDQFGGPEVMQLREIDMPPPAAGEARIRHTAIGVNFIDIYHRTGLYPLALPSGLGSEAAGVVESIGEGVTEVSPGDRVVYSGRPADAYSQYRNFSVWQLVRIPDAISDEHAAAVFLKGMTAWFLLHRSYEVQPGDSILVYAAAGGVGSILTQWAKHLGAHVIGIVGSEEKAATAARQGCDATILSNSDNVAAEVREQTGGVGVAAVYDSIGRDTFFQSLDCLRPHGVMVTFGNASGPVEPFAPSELAARHSLYVTRPVLFDFISSRDALVAASAALFDLLEDEIIEVAVNQRYALADVAQAHTDLAARLTSGSTVLLP